MATRLTALDGPERAYVLALGRGSSFAEALAESGLKSRPKSQRVRDALDEVLRPVVEDEIMTVDEALRWLTAVARDGRAPGDLESPPASIGERRACVDQLLKAQGGYKPAEIEVTVRHEGARPLEILDALDAEYQLT